MLLASTVRRGHAACAGENTQGTVGRPGDLSGRVDRLVLESRAAADLIEVRLRGDLDIYTSPKLDRHLHAEFDCSDFSKLVLDLSEVTALDSTGIHALWTIRHELDVTGRRLILRAPSLPVRRILGLVGLLSRFEVE